MPRGAGFRRLTGRQRIQRNFYRPDWRWKWFSGSRSFAAVVAPYLLPSLNLRQHFIRKCHLVHDYPLSVNAGCRLGLYLLLRNAQRTRVARNRKEMRGCPIRKRKNNRKLVLSFEEPELAFWSKFASAKAAHVLFLVPL